MPFLRMLRSKAAVGGGVVLVAALVLAGCAQSPSSSGAYHSSVTITPSSLDPSSMCSSSNGFLRQSFNGDVTGCFRVPVLHGAALVVALQTDLLNTSRATNSRATTTLAPIATGHVSLSVSPRTVTPGETVTVTGTYANDPPPRNQNLANLCWDGCRTGLQESIQLHWTSRFIFHTSLVVPDTAWLVSNKNAVSVHPLKSGRYKVGIECLGDSFGCDLGGVEAQTTIRLKAPKPERCLPGQQCEVLHLSTSSASVGDVINVSGWAPLQTIIGQPFGYDFTVTKGQLKQQYPPLSFSRTSKGGSFQVVLAPSTLRVTPSKTWADLIRPHYVSATWSGPSAVNPQSHSNLVAWCETSGIEITDGATHTMVPTVNASAALKGTSLTMGSPSSSRVPCTTVLLDSRYRSSVYAGFGSEQGGSMPPVYLAGLYTTDRGAIWHTVPTPPGESVASFGGFTTEGDSVLALFAGIGSVVNNTPGGTTNGLVSAEVTSNGGVTWSPTTLGCPTSGPCTTFGPYNTGYCNMSNAPQSLLIGPSNGTKSAGVKWTRSSWVTSVNSCFSQQLVVTSPHGLLLLDPSSPYKLLKSTNGGATWTYFALPSIPGMNAGADSAPADNSLVLAPDGSLFASVTTPNGQREELFRLLPAATSWCQVPKAFGATGPTSYIGSLRVNKSDLMWTESHYPNGAAPSTRLHVAPYSSLRC